MFKTITLKGGLVLEGKDLVLFEYSNPNSNAMKKPPSQLTAAIFVKVYYGDAVSRKFV